MVMNLEKNLEVNQLISLYGALLNPKQLKVLEDYYFFDATLAEIADEMGVSRQAVNDLIKRVVKTLYKYEKALHLQQKQSDMLARLNKLPLLSGEQLGQEVEEIMKILEG